ncbi:MAG: putative FKBP-type peptidyl-prolyl cis-trans isomerase [Methanobacterium sp. PtaU1.Bin242]|nr:MAG: putative FKBP-type peptidyl-prolyl cis-trans isomerase [Methanobacterium sp. PtaU1.Bin242]
MSVKKGDFLKLEYTGRIQETGEVFDTTDEKVAEEEGILSENKTYGAIPIIVGAGHVLKGIEDALVDMGEGDENTVEIPPQEGFGERDPKLMQLVPMSEFRKQGIKPQVGMSISSEGGTGIIRSISGGRVRVDFNHELAGKNLQYQIKVQKIIDDDEEKIRSMIDLHYPNPSIDSSNHQVKIEEGKVVIQMDEMTKFDKKPYMDITFARFRISRDIWENMENVDKVEFVDVFEKKVKEEDEKTAKDSETVAEEVTEEKSEELTKKSAEDTADIAEESETDETQNTTTENTEPIAEEVLEERIEQKEEN